MEFNPNFTYMLWSAMAENNVYHKDKTIWAFIYSHFTAIEMGKISTSSR
jgi:hypothetical protein